jgi:hypothetical protein
MKVLGLRVSPTEARFALVEKLGDDFVFHNKAADNRLVFPAGAAAVNDKVSWLYEEARRVLRADADIEHVSIKSPEFAGTENGARRDTIRLETAVMLAASNAGTPVTTRLYGQLGARRNTVKQAAEDRVERSDVRWNEQMADAVLAAWSIARGG